MNRQNVAAALAILVAAGLAGCGDQAETPPSIAYAFSYDEGAVGVSLTFTGDADGGTLLELPNEWGGETELYNTLQLGSIQGATIAETDAPHELLLTHEPGAQVTVTYQVIQDWEGVPGIQGRNPYRPVIQPDYVHMIGWAMLIVPDYDAMEGDQNISLAWDGWPADWEIADNVGWGRETRRFTGDINRLQAGIFVAGDFRLTEIDVGGAPLRFAIRGEWAFSDGELTSRIARIVQSQRDFWGETSSDPFLVTLIQLDNGGHDRSTSWGGTQLVDSFALFAAPNTPIEGFEQLSAHEIMHRWIPRTFGQMGDPETEIYWFSEGFTDYYATLISLRAGIIDLQGFADQVNQALREYYRSSARGATNEEVGAQFWESRDFNRYPYLHGRFFAMRANMYAMALAEWHSLDDVLLWWRDYRQEQFGEGHREPFTTEDVELAFINSYMTNAAYDVQQHIVNGEPVPIEQGMFGPCFTLSDVAFPIYEIGFDHNASYEALAVTGVREGGPAWNAGLRDGMPFGGYSIPSQGDPNTEATFWARLEPGGEMTPVTYQPQSGEVETIPQIALLDPLFASDEAACLAWWGAG